MRYTPQRAKPSRESHALYTIACVRNVRNPQHVVVVGCFTQFAGTRPKPTARNVNLDWP